MSFNVESLVGVALVALISGASNALGIWLVSRHIINRLESKGRQEKDSK